MIGINPFFGNIFDKVHYLEDHVKQLEVIYNATREDVSLQRSYFKLLVQWKIFSVKSEGSMASGEWLRC